MNYVYQPFLFSSCHHMKCSQSLNVIMLIFLVELQKRKARKTVSDLEEHSLEEEEKHFWEGLIKNTLKPIPEKFNDSKTIKKLLLSARNIAVVVLLLVNLIWILMLSSLSFWQLSLYGIDPRAFNLLFLAVYGLIILIQFFTMLAHRAVTFIHYLGRIKSICKITKIC